MNKHIIKRSKIENLLNGIYDSPLYIVSAPMGNGKTVAVRSFVESCDAHVIWMSLFASGVEGYYWDMLCRQVVEIEPKLAEQLIEAGIPKDEYSTINAIGIICRYKYTKEIVVVLDDYHIVSNPFFKKLIINVIKENVQNLHIVVLTRDTYLSDFTEVACMVDIMTSSHLKFDGEDVKQLMNEFSVKATKENVNKVLNYSGGWASVVFLLVKGMSQGLTIDDNIEVNKLIRNTIFMSFDDDIKDSLMHLSFLSSFTLEQGEYIAGREVTNKLTQLSESIPYIQINKNLCIIHSMLLGFLQSEVRRQDINLTENYIRAGRWSLNEGDYVNAFRYYDLGNNIEELLDSMSNGKSMNLFHMPEFVYEILNKCTENLYIKYPYAFLDIGCQLMFSNNDKYRELGVKIIMTLNGTAQADRHIFGDQTDRILAETYLMNIFINFGNMDAMCMNLDRALELLDGRASMILGKDAEITLGSPHTMYLYYTEGGKFRETAERVAESISKFSLIADGCGAGTKYAAMAEYYLETGDLQQAEENAHKALYAAGAMQQIGIMLCAYFVLIRINILTGSRQEIDRLIEEAEEKVIFYNNGLYMMTVDLIKGYVFSILKLKDRIPAWLLNNEEMDEEYRMIGSGYYNIVKGKILILNKNYNLLEVETFIAGQAFAVYNNRLGILNNKIHIAINQILNDKDDEAKQALKDALDYARCDRLAMPFVETSCEIMQVLEKIVNDDREDDFVVYVLSLCRKYHKNIRSLIEKPCLTDAEIKVLRLLAQGKSRSEIAYILMVSTNTVKTHISRTYKKLGVSSKMNAIAKARQYMTI